MARDPNKYRINGLRVPSVTEVLKLSGWSDVSHIPPDILQAAAARGTFVHDATELLDEDDLDWDTVPDAYLGYVRSYEAFIAKHRPVLLASEEVVKNETFLYAGQLDRRWQLQGRKWVVDLKTSANEQVSWRYQLSAYAEPQVEPHLRAALMLRKDGSEAKWVPYDNDREDWAVFAAAAITVNAQLRAGVIVPTWAITPEQPDPNMAFAFEEEGA